MSGRVPSPQLNYDYSVVTAETDQSATLLLDAKNEYNKQLVSHLRQPVFNLMKSIYNGAENICHQENTPENILMVYQDNLAQVPKWPKTRRSKEYDEFLKISKCDWFNELIKFTYVTHVKILTIVNKPRPNVKLSISVPSGGAFYHSVCINVARELWRSPFLFSKHVGKYEYQKNMRQIEQIIDNSVDACIRAHIPMKTILQDYLDSDLTAPPVNQHTSSSKPSNPAPPIEQPTVKEEFKAPVPNIHESTNPESTIPESTKSESKEKPSSRTSKLVINNAIDEFIDTKQSTDITNVPDAKSNDKVTQALSHGDDMDLESVNFKNHDEIVDELDIIETAIEDKESAAGNEVYDDLSEIQLSRTPTPNPPNPAVLGLNTTIESPSASASATATNLKEGPSSKEDSNVKTQNIEEFDIDSLPEISLGQLIDTNPPTKPSITESTSKTIPISAKHIPISDLNEPGMGMGMGMGISELKQPTPAKKQLIVEDLPTDDLDEVNLGAHAEELRTTKRIALPGQNTQITAKPKNFAFF